MSETIFLISSFLGSKPRALMATFSSLASMVPLPSYKRNEREREKKKNEKYKKLTIDCFFFFRAI
jgi:hypothetical protein